MSGYVNTSKQLPARKDMSRLLFCCSIIIGITLIAFLPSLDNGFTNWDDEYYVVNNPDIKSFSFNNLAKIFSSQYVFNYQPLTMLTYMVEHSIFGLTPAVYHWTNLIIHILNGLLVFALFYALSGHYMTGLLVGLLFAIHPLRVESVAWIAERKDVLSAFFYFFSLLLYVKYLKGKKRKFYWLCAFFLLLSLLSKPMAVSQPFVLLLICYFKNGKPDKKALSDTIPFFAITAVFVVITILTQRIPDSFLDNYSLSTLQRICVPFYGMAFYLAKTIVPIHLSAFYPFPAALDSGMNLQLIIAPFFVIGIAIAIWLFRARSRTLVFGSLFFLITVLPVIQIVHVGSAIVAERYTYIPMLGIYFIFANLLRLFFAEKYRASITGKSMIAGGMSISLIAFACITYERCCVWKDSFSLWNDVLSKYNVDAAYYFRGTAYNAQRNYKHAIEDFDQAIILNPKYAVVYNDRGGVYFNNGDYNRAIEDYTEAIRLIPTYALAYGSRGAVYSQKGDFDRAIEDYSEAIRIDPRGAFASYCNRGMAYGNKGDPDRAIKDFTQAIKLNPQYMQVYYYRGLAYKGKGDYNRATDDIKKACDLGFDPACQQLRGN